ncbi:amidase [Microbaculum marinisediminis]|uniref:Amidase n=1 Tax=Microbaculum marinisediminis TaxID=2931392 RepID=A0AAW5QU23_9HYPH|nr:amidase [Microbaculum sp. A6E488]MCT8970437.1 amidase [Microbaculum sp. A6E488]
MAVSGARAMNEMPGTGLADLGIVELAGLVAAGTVKAEEVTQACLARIADREPEVCAWAHLDADYALAQARALDAHRASGRPLGPLHGVPIGIKDIIDVRGLPCERGTVLDQGRRPGDDAAVVARLRAAGAVILGKTVTTELAVYAPGKTRNPHDPARTPGGSSSGSAAAVAAGMVPGALGTQTNGSVIRPASFCGVYGFKPSHDLVSRRGVLTESPIFDSIGTMARSIEDASLLADVIAGYDPADPWMRTSGPPKLLETATAEPPVRPTLAFVRTPVWDRADDDTRAGFAELCDVLGDAIDEVALPEPFDRAIDLHRTVMNADIARHFARYYDDGRDRLSARLREIIEDGRRVLAVDYILAREWVDILNGALEQIFDRYDAIVTPAAPGEAPGLEATGDPAFCTIWTYCQVPAVTVPLMVGDDGLPIGVQVVGRRGQDGRLLRTARWLAGELATHA